MSSSHHLPPSRTQLRAWNKSLPNGPAERTGHLRVSSGVCRGSDDPSDPSLLCPRLHSPGRFRGSVGSEWRITGCVAIKLMGLTGLVALMDTLCIRNGRERYRNALKDQIQRLSNWEINTWMTIFHKTHTSQNYSDKGAWEACSSKIKKAHVCFYNNTVHRFVHMFIS